MTTLLFWSKLNQVHPLPKNLAASALNLSLKASKEPKVASIYFFTSPTGSLLPSFLFIYFYYFILNNKLKLYGKIYLEILNISVFLM